MFFQPISEQDIFNLNNMNSVFTHSPRRCWFSPLAEDGRLPSACRPLHLFVAGGGVAAGGPDVGGADRRVDGPLPGRIRVGRLDAGVQPAPLVHGAGHGVPAGRR